MTNIARGQITIHSLDDLKLLFIRYSDDGGKTFTKAKPWVEIGEYGNGRNLATFYDGSVREINLNNGINQVFNLAGINKAAGGHIVQMSCKIEFINCEISDKSLYWAQASNTNEWGWGYGASKGSVVANGVVDYHWSTKLPTVTKDGIFALRFDNIKGKVRISEPCITIGDTRYPYSPAPENLQFGTTKGEYLGTLIWDKPYPSDNVSDYTWSKIDGKDAEFYKLNPLIETAAVDKDGKLGLSLKYNIQHIVGATISNVTAGDYYIRFRPNTTTTNTNLSTNTITPLYNNASYQTNYYRLANKINYFTVELVKGNLILDTRVVTVILLPAALFIPARLKT